MSKVSSFLEVRERLFSMYSGVLANSLLGFWVQLVILGEDETKKNFKKETFYRYLRQLKKASVTWENADFVDIKKNIQVIDELNKIRAMFRIGVQESQIDKEFRQKIMVRIGRIKSWLYLDEKLKKAYVNKKACSCITNYTPRAENFDVASTVR